MLEYYILKYDANRKEVVRYNIFQNIHIYERTEKETKKYLRSPKKYSRKKFLSEEILYGFEAFCEEIKMIIKCELWSRRQYEISVGDAFETDCDKLEKLDGYYQCEKNIPVIAREVIYQYKQKRKAKNEVQD